MCIRDRVRRPDVLHFSLGAFWFEIVAHIFCTTRDKVVPCLVILFICIPRLLVTETSAKMERDDITCNRYEFPCSLTDRWLGHWCSRTRDISRRCFCLFNLQGSMTLTRWPDNLLFLLRGSTWSRRLTFSLEVSVRVLFFVLFFLEGSFSNNLLGRFIIHFTLTWACCN